jgi:hypothetical protein
MTKPLESDTRASGAAHICATKRNRVSQAFVSAVPWEGFAWD